MFMSSGRLTGVVAAALLAGGCAQLPLAEGKSNVDALVQSRIALNAATGPDADAQVVAWLAEPLTLEAAQRIALLRNPALKAAYAQLGLSAADVFEAGRLHNPTIGLSWLFPLSGADGTQFSAAGALGFTELLLRSSRRQLAATEYQAAQHDIAAAVLALMADTQRAWIDCVAATQREAVRQSIADAARLSAELADRYLAAGNIGQLELQMQRADASMAGIDLRTAQMALADARARLQTLLGLGRSEQAWQVPRTLPELPARPAPVPLADLQSLALQQRLDLAAARRRAEAAQAGLRNIRRYRWLGEAQLGAEYEREAGASRLGPSMELSLPLFQQGQGSVARADARQQDAAARVVQLENGILAEVEQQQNKLALARLQVEAFRDGLIPQREAIVLRLTEQANYMLVDGFAVLLARQQEYAAYAGYVEALQHYWSTQVELLRAVGSQRGTEVAP